MSSKPRLVLILLASLLTARAHANLVDCAKLTFVLDERGGKGPAQHFFADNGEDEGLYVNLIGTCHDSHGERCQFPITASFDYPLSQTARTGKPDALFPLASDCLADGSGAMSQARERIEHELSPRFNGLRLPSNSRQESRASVVVRAHFAPHPKRRSN